MSKAHNPFKSDELKESTMGGVIGTRTRLKFLGSGLLLFFFSFDAREIKYKKISSSCLSFFFSPTCIRLERLK